MLNAPPTNIFPSELILILSTLLSNPTPKFDKNEVSTVPLGFNLINLPQEYPSKLVKIPPTNILPSTGWIAIVYTAWSNPFPTVKVLSIVPPDVSLSKPFLELPEKLLKAPPTKIFPSFCICISYTIAELNPIVGINVASLTPSVSTLIKPLLLVSNCELYDVKSPPINILSSDCTLTIRTIPPNEIPVVPNGTLVPSESNLIIPLETVNPLY